jgi:hypothetical protein
MKTEQEKQNTTMLLIAVVVVLVLLALYFYNKQERLTEPEYLNQMTMASQDPVAMNYLGYERDVSGMSARDYYVENQMNASSGVGPQYLENDNQFQDKTGFMNMPIKYRPIKNPSASALQTQASLVSNNLEEYAFQDLTKDGFY